MLSEIIWEDLSNRNFNKYNEKTENVEKLTENDLNKIIINKNDYIIKLPVFCICDETNHHYISYKMTRPLTLKSLLDLIYKFYNTELTKKQVIKIKCSNLELDLSDIKDDDKIGITWLDTCYENFFTDEDEEDLENMCDELEELNLSSIDNEDMEELEIDDEDEDILEENIMFNNIEIKDNQVFINIKNIIWCQI